MKQEMIFLAFGSSSGGSGGTASLTTDEVSALGSAWRPATDSLATWRRQRGSGSASDARQPVNASGAEMGQEMESIT